MKLLNLLIPGFGRPRWKIYLWLGWTGIVTGSGFLLVAIGLASYEAFFLAHSSETQGTVVANVESKIAANQETQTPAHTDYCPEFEYQSTDGVTHKVTGSCSDPPSFTIGERVRVKYANWDYDTDRSIRSAISGVCHCIRIDSGRVDADWICSTSARMFARPLA